MTDSRRKGINGELEACKLFRPYFPDVRRSFGQARKGYEQPDLIGGVEKRFFVEVKRCNKEPSRKVLGHWLSKLNSDVAKFNKKLSQVLMWRADYSKEWSVILVGGKFGRTLSWEGFVAAVLGPTKNMEVRDE